MQTPALFIFDIGKTNKKIIVFDEQYNLLHEESCELLESSDEDGDACEDIDRLTAWVRASMNNWIKQKKFKIKGVNVSAYGASFVHLDEQFKLATPLYNYLKPYPKALEQNFYQAYGGVTKITRETASPVLGSLNSGLQLYRLKCESPEIYGRIKYSLHLPQYIIYLLTGKLFSEITSIGCHTLLWDFEKNNYHEWVTKEGIDKKFPRLMKSNEGITVDYDEKKIVAGSGLHDSSAALIPYLASFSEPFVLISTGTWCISLNPYNDSPLTDEELKHDCLCYLSYQGTPVKASRIFSGNDHEVQTKRMAVHFEKSRDYYKSISFNPDLVASIRSKQASGQSFLSTSGFRTEEVSLAGFLSYEEAYHKLMMDIVTRQKISTDLVLKGTPVKKIFVDGGFSKNPLFMYLLAEEFPGYEIYGAMVAQATALGAGLAIHSHWNKNSIVNNLITLRRF